MAEAKGWSGWPDSNRRPPDPQPVAEGLELVEDWLFLNVFADRIIRRTDFRLVRTGECGNLWQSSDRLFERAHRLRIPATGPGEIRRRLADVVVPQPSLNRRERHVRIHPARPGFASQ